jgi:hypothetical protein
MRPGGELRRALRMFLLPMRVRSEGTCGRALVGELRKRGVALQDFVSWVSLQLGDWRDSGDPSLPLIDVVSAVLTVADKHYGELVAAEYFSVHQKLRVQHLMGHDEAIAFLSHAFLMCELSDRDNLSAAQISRLLERRDARVSFSRQSVATALQTLSTKPGLTERDVTRLFMKDAQLELPALADADLSTSAEVVGEAALTLGFRGDPKAWLSTLGTESGWATHAPYLQMLHYQSTIAEFFDHAMTDLYEFSPRGNAAVWLFSQYPTQLATAGNPFLNNAKSVERIDEQWVRSKKQNERAGASALFNILSAMEAMGFAARRELARWVRLWLHRVMRIAALVPSALPAVWSHVEVDKLLKSIAGRNSETFGVLEQRIVDAIASILHPSDSKWRGRGLGDSVNTTNLSRRKLGDCDFQNTDSREIAAYESHGGELTRVYLDEHLRTLSKCVLNRVEEIQGVAEVKEWSASVTFVAHRLNVKLPIRVELHGLHVEIHGITYEALIKKVRSSDATNAINEHVLTRLHDRRTPEEVRVRSLKIVNA